MSRNTLLSSIELRTREASKQSILIEKDPFHFRLTQTLSSKAYTMKSNNLEKKKVLKKFK